MRYHYFTIEQRDALSREIQRMWVAEPEGLGAALSRLRSPDFGICAVCQADVPFSRLIGNPLALRCRACEARA